MTSTTSSSQTQEAPTNTASTEKLNMLLDMETSDPDDFFTLCLLAAHPKVTLRGVTVTPGSRDQIGIVKATLRLILGPEKSTQILVGSDKPNYPKSCVAPFHYNVLGKVGPADPDETAEDVMKYVFKKYPDCTVVTGAPLTNFANFMTKNPAVQVKKWVAQGGFAGDNVVPKEYRLHQFDGKEFCSTFNFGGNVQAAMMLLECNRIEKKILVSKNVCHGVIYDQAFHEKMKPYHTSNPGLKMIYTGMDTYLQKKDGKKFHDPLAACVAIDQSIGMFVEVKVNQRKGQFGSEPKTGTNTFIIIHADQEKFFNVMVNKI